MAYHGINFRATSGFVTNGTGETHSLGEAYPITRGGETFGFSIDLTGGARDRDNTLDRRLAGGVQRANSAGVFKFFFDLPEGAGTYDVRLALGDPANPQNHRCLIRDGDGGTVLATINDDTGSGDPSWLDANGVERIGLPDGLPTPTTKWPLANTANRLAFTGTQMVLDLGNHSSGTNSTFLAHVSMESVATGATLSSPTVVSTGNGIATVGATTDTAPTVGTPFNVRTRPAADPAWTATQVNASPTQSITSGAAGARTFALTSLVNGTPVAADYAHGASNVVSTASFTPSTVPGAPTIGTAVAGNASATVNGTAPASNGGAAITGYRSTATPGGSTVTGATLPIIHTGLTNGVPYTFTLAAENLRGFGAESAASNSVTPSAGAPPPPPPPPPSGVGFDFHTAAGCVFGAISGSLVGLAREVGVSITPRVYNDTTGALVATLPATATNSAGRLPRLTDAALVAATFYTITFRWPDGAVYSIRMAAT